MQTLKTDNGQIRKTGKNVLSKLKSLFNRLKSFFNRWRIATIILILAYVISVLIFFPLAFLTITSVNVPIDKMPLNDNGVTVNQNVTNLIGRDHFDVGDIAVFSFNITNTHAFAVNCVFNSSITFSQYGYPQSFTLNASQSTALVEELPVNTQGSNGFLFTLTVTYDSSTDILHISQTINAISFSDELSLVSSQSTFLLAMLLGAFALVAAVKEFKELGEKREQNSTSKKIRVCNYCDGENPSDNIFCNWCGKKLKETLASRSEKQKLSEANA